MRYHVPLSGRAIARVACLGIRSTTGAATTVTVTMGSGSTTATVGLLTAVAALASGVLPGWVLGVCAGVTLVSGLDEAWLACRATTLDADARGSWAA